MKTAIELVIDDFKAIWKDGYDITAEAAIKICETHLHTEKQQIADAYNQGYREGEVDNGVEVKDVSEFENANIYFTEKFTQ